MDVKQRGPQRTGWVILVLMVVSNFMAWMEPLVSVTAGMEAIGAMQLRLSLGACVLAAALVTGTWLAGRHSTSPAPFAHARLVGFRLALAAAAMNILFGVLIAALGPYGSLDAYRISLAVQGAWLLFVLPGEVLSAYLTGKTTVRRGPVPVEARG